VGAERKEPINPSSPKKKTHTVLRKKGRLLSPYTPAIKKAGKRVAIQAMHPPMPTLVSVLEDGINGIRVSEKNKSKPSMIVWIV
jgi:hypothetical protein